MPNITLSRKIIWSLATFLVLSVPFIGLLPWPSLGHIQAVIVWLAATLLLIDVIISPQDKQPINYLWFAPLVPFLYGLVSTTLLSGSWQTVLLGLDNEFLGSWTLLSCVVIGLLIARKLRLELLNYFYWSTVALAGVSIIFDVASIARNERLTGLVWQSDVLAIILGAGLTAALFISFKAKKQYVIAAHSLVMSAILLTRTRAVVYLLPLWLLFAFIKYRSHLKISDRMTKYGLAGASIFILTAGIYAAPRVLSVSRAEFGISYRMDLVSHGSKYLAIMPPWGFGPAALSLVGTDYYQLPKSLEHTMIADQKIPESAHALFLDRFLEYGWVAGLAYLALIIVTVVAAIRTRRNKLTLALTAVGGYLLIQQSVAATSSIVELLTWICILGILMQAAKEGKPPHTKTALIWSAVVLYIGLLGLFVQVRLDQSNSQVRLVNNFTFPLDTSKKDIQTGSSFNNQVLVWESDVTQSYHHDYLAADIHVAEGTSVLTAKGGQVVAVRNVETCGARHFPAVTIYGVDGFYYYYTHLKPGSIQASVGDSIETGQQFAQVGSSTCAQGSAPHLHLDISRFPYAARGGWAAPFTFIDPQPALIKAYQVVPEK